VLYIASQECYAVHLISVMQCVSPVFTVHLITVIQCVASVNFSESHWLFFIIS